MTGGGGTFFDDYVPGDVFRHARGKTVSVFDGAGLAQLVMNTSDGHFNDHVMRDTEAGEAVVFGGLTLAIVVGLAMQDTAENALAERSLADVRLRRPVRHGDTLYTVTEVIDVGRADADAGDVTFRHWGLNQRDEVVLECLRTVCVRRRAAAR